MYRRSTNRAGNVQISEIWLAGKLVVFFRMAANADDKTSADEAAAEIDGNFPKLGT